MKGNNLGIASTNARWYQLFRVKGQRIVNERNKALDLQGGLDKEGQNIIVNDQNDELNQKWTIIYVKDIPPKLKDCEMNKEFNIKVNCDFHV